MPIPATTPPQDPRTVYATFNATDPTKWDLKTSIGISIATGVAQSSVIPTVANYLRTAGAGLSTLVNILTPSGNPLSDFPLPSAQLGDLSQS
jgi:hypothetical protein